LRVVFVEIEGFWCDGGLRGRSRIALHRAALGYTWGNGHRLGQMEVLTRVR
jgi:hypothetical protein